MVGKVHCIFFSPCGGTENVIKAVGRDIRLPKQFHNITLPRNRTRELRFGENDLVIMGFPVYGGRMPRHFSSLIAHLNGGNTPLVMVAVYGNREYEGAFWDMHELSRSNGFRPVAAIAAVAEHSASPVIAANRPDANDQDTLAGFGLQIIQKAQDGTAIEAPGAYPAWKLSPDADVFPRTDEQACTKCGYCAEVCPNSAISANEPQETIKDNCLVCAACVKYCPQHARMLGSPETKKELASHLVHAVERKEAVLFL